MNRLALQPAIARELSEARTTAPAGFEPVVHYLLTVVLAVKNLSAPTAGSAWRMFLDRTP
jgi:hypothetical protein